MDRSMFLDAVCSGFDGPVLSAPVLGAAFLGIDCGLAGYASLITPGRPAVIECFKTPVFLDEKGRPKKYNIHEMWNLAHSWEGRVELALLERQQAYPGQGAVSNFTTGYGYALWEMALIAAGIPYQVLLPVQWKKGMDILPPRAASGDKAKLVEGLSEKEAKKKLSARDRQRKKQAKQMAVSATQRLFPGIDLRRTELCVKPDDNKCEAILMAEYVRRLHAGR